MIESVTVVNHHGESVEMVLSNPNTSGFIVKEMSGLGPAKAHINTSSSAFLRGSQYNSAKIESRNIVLHLIMLESPSVEDNRHKLYNLFQPAQPVELIFNTTNRKSRIAGWVESNEPDIFSEMESAQVSVLCPDPYFRDATFEGGRLSKTFNSYNPSFEFPFSNESLTSKTLEVGTLEPVRSVSIDYPGDVETGVVIEFVVLDAAGFNGGFEIYNETYTQRFEIDRQKLGLGYTPSAGDRFQISTVSGDLKMTAFRPSTMETTNVTYGGKVTGGWPKLRPGDNLLGVNYVAGEIDNLTITADVLYGGV